jgi:hypothetical protein
MIYLSEYVCNQLYMHNLQVITRVPSFNVDWELLFTVDVKNDSKSSQTQQLFNSVLSTQ